MQNYGNIQFTGTPADGFVLGKNASGQRYRTQIGNRVYTVIPISVALTVTKTGNVSLGPFTASMVVVLPSSNQGGDAFFNQFFNQGQQKQVTLATDQIKVESSAAAGGKRAAEFQRCDWPIHHGRHRRADQCRRRRSHHRAHSNFRPGRSGFVDAAQPVRVA